MNPDLQDNKHVKAGKVRGFWDYIVRDPGDYVGKHRADDHVKNGVFMDCPMCLYRLSS